jgi:phospholipase/lecithinase/hemolysin
VSEACYANMKVCDTPSSDLFWDSLHPTSRAHALLAAGMANAVPGPLPVLGGLVAYSWSRQLRQRVRLGARQHQASPL